MTIIPYTSQENHAFTDLMVGYFAELDSGIPEEIIRGKLSDLIDRQCMDKTIHAAVAVADGKPVGFSIYQIDMPQSDWCKRPGWGFIREFYVIPERRCVGIGKTLAYYTERSLHSLGAEKLYLTADNAISFWQKCGWRLTEEICSNELNILEK